LVKYACMTGADRGLGLALTRQLLQAGYSVFAGKFLSDWDELSKLQAEYPDQLIQILLDVGNDDSVKAAAAEIRSRTDKLELIINNAAIIGNDRQQSILDDELDIDDMLRTFNVTGLGSLRVTNALIEPLLSGDSKLIVNISSEAGSVNQSWRTNFYGYCMAKTALNMHSTITYNRIIDLGGHVLNLHPGWMQGHLSGQLSTIADLTPEFSAEKLMEIISRYRTYQTNQPAFLDYLGRKLPW
jgi:NAD(P)-dependent dehydrogenase (short-subunit alcohol dehydrogenase family)